MAKQMTINPTEQKILDVLSNANEPMTLSEISEKGGFEKPLVSGNINALITSKGKVVKCGEKEITYTAKKKVATYRLVQNDPALVKLAEQMVSCYPSE